MNDNDSNEFNSSDARFGGLASARNVWITCLTINCTILAIHFWITLRFLIYAIKTKRRKSSSVNGGPIIMSAAVAIVLPFPRYLATLSVLLITLDGKNDAGCEIGVDFGKAAYALSVFCMYGFFWFRQRAFYQHPSLGGTFGKCSTVMSYASIFIIGSFAIALMPISVFPLEYKASPQGCVRNGEHQYPFRNYLYAGAMIVSQILVLCLFIHPLRIHRNANKKAFQTKPSGENDKQQSKSDRYRSESSDRTMPSTEKYQLSNTDNSAPRSSCQVQIQSSSQTQSCSLDADVQATEVKRTKTPAKTKKKSTKKSQDRVYSLIKRTFALAFLSAITDLMTMIVVGLILPNDTQEIVRGLLYNVDLFINVATVIASFENCKAILLPNS